MGGGVVININMLQWKLEETKGVIRDVKSKEQTLQLSAEKTEIDKQWSTKHHTENQRSWNTNLTKNTGLKQN